MGQTWMVGAKYSLSNVDIIGNFMLNMLLHKSSSWQILIASKELRSSFVPTIIIILPSFQEFAAISRSHITCRNSSHTQDRTLLWWSERQLGAPTSLKTRFDGSNLIRGIKNFAFCVCYPIEAEAHEVPIPHPRSPTKYLWDSTHF
jgi:hypothetical protein